MTIIKASCPTCGDCELGPTDIDLQVHEDDAWSMSTYAFACPRCREVVLKPANDYIISLLISGGVQVRQIRIPAEARETHSGKPISYDDLLDLCLAMAGTNCLAGLA